MTTEELRTAIVRGDTSLGMELGSTRMKAVLIGPDHSPAASGSFAWTSRCENGVWTYSSEEIWAGVRACFRALADDVLRRYQVPLTTAGSMGFSAMMHGGMLFGRDGSLLLPFRTWRNMITPRAADEMTELFSFTIPQRWSIAHLYQAVLDREPFLTEADYFTTLAGYVHWKLTGRRVTGVGDASGMFPVDSATCNYRGDLLGALDEKLAPLGYRWALRDLLPAPLAAGEDAGVLTEEGARLLDPTGVFRPGVPICPPEGDADAGLVATNSVAPGTGNVSAGTSVFAVLVLDRPLKGRYPNVTLLASPTGGDVAVMQGNNCTTELNAWTGLFLDTARLLGAEPTAEELLTALSREALAGEPDCGGLVLYNYLAGEPMTGLDDGRPVLLRGPEGRLTLANLMRAHLYSALAVMRLGMDNLRSEGVTVARMLGHGGLFKTPGVGQRFLAAALRVPVCVMETAGEGGAWGMALLAAYARGHAPGEPLADYLETRVFSALCPTPFVPLQEDVEGFTRYMERYLRCLPVERAAVERLPHG